MKRLTVGKLWPHPLEVDRALHIYTLSGRAKLVGAAQRQELETIQMAFHEQLHTSTLSPQETFL